jgi:uncharacterized membrane protein
MPRFLRWHRLCKRLRERAMAQRCFNPEEKTVMQTKRALISAAVGGLVALAQVAIHAQPAATPNFPAEKCYGIAKAGKNDCAANGHACQGQAKADANGKEWIYVPSGTCARVVGGSATAK